jgi:hypothetical protein
MNLKKWFQKKQPTIAPAMMHSIKDEAAELHKLLEGGMRFDWWLTDSWPLHLYTSKIQPKVALQMSALTFMFHVRTWMDQTGNRPQDVCVSLKSHTDLNFDTQFTGVLLLPEEMIADFNNWWEPYVERFGIVENMIFPDIPNAYQMDATIFNHAGMFYRETSTAKRILPSNEFFEQWCWIVKNCKGKVWVTPSHFFFEDSADAVYFMLTNEIRDLKAKK